LKPGYLVTVFAVLFLSACVRVDEPTSHWRRSSHVTTRDIHGVRVHVQTIRNQQYALEFRDTRATGSQHVWHPLPGAERFLGNGEVMEFLDAHPNARFRAYRVQTLGDAPAQPPQRRER